MKCEAEKAVMFLLPILIITKTTERFQIFHSVNLIAAFCTFPLLSVQTSFPLSPFLEHERSSVEAKNRPDYKVIQSNATQIASDGKSINT